MSRFISTGVRGLDDLLEGGVETQAITEFIGEFGAGKTQLCHQLAVMVQLPVEQGGLEAKALYIDAEGTFRPERIIQIAKYRQQNPEQTLENIIYARAFTIEELLKIVMSLRNIEGIGLIILDSVSFHFSFYKDLNQYNRNIAMICLILNELLDLSIKKDICVVVTDFFINDKILCDPRCLHYIGKRIIIEKLDGNTRLIKSLFPPYEGVVKVNIDKNGITEK